MNTLSHALELAAKFHDGQVDKVGQPYIMHVIRVMVGLGHSATEIDRCVALLHDAVEDSNLSLGTIREGFGNEVADAVDALTRRPREPYSAYIERLSMNLLAKKVKLADLEDNLDRARIPVERSFEFGPLLTRYWAAQSFLHGNDYELLRQMMDTKGSGNA